MFTPYFANIKTNGAQHRSNHLAKINRNMVFISAECVMGISAFKRAF
ncbi:hypothetical protein HMPREF1144_0383 [Klebsiella sp. OBRC7]|uniref:Uncharacterized protein n=2 Tax=Klebsiella/Raoultella group TaxID=2890311 RepID=A0A6G6AQH2_KLEPN|nr:hypothetical protein HMPREF1144_0383 [Klebsiella sp. OBRC7]QID23933.1 hypothetical protein [Klebsiella pneumoniae]QNL32406.1 Hypothetical protein [Raoultella ornithinolytica]UFD96455.1 hypothetical protein [Klebsiella oxytoca]UFD97193.1 hypothetical protein [Klebsiella pneumoniae]